jgi:SagB-type dehydrogenase family enzyme
VELYRPDLEDLHRRDPPFVAVMERRCTLRAAGPDPITARQLGELLFRCARVRGCRTSPRGELSDRPYPGAGAIYELEIYPLVHRCDGIEAALYHYCPFTHRLERLAGEAAAARDLLEAARAAYRLGSAEAGAPEPLGTLPDVLLIIAARFQRIAWKYEAIAYALLLKDVGVLLQTIYLAATAMSLSPCALGHGDPDRFCRAAGTDPYVEASVGEIALSSRADRSSSP